MTKDLHVCSLLLLKLLRSCIGIFPSCECGPHLDLVRVTLFFRPWVLVCRLSGAEETGTSCGMMILFMTQLKQKRHCPHTLQRTCTFYFPNNIASFLIEALWMSWTLCLCLRPAHTTYGPAKVDVASNTAAARVLVHILAWPRHLILVVRFLCLHRATCPCYYVRRSRHAIETSHCIMSDATWRRWR